MAKKYTTDFLNFGHTGWKAISCIPMSEFFFNLVFVTKCGVSVSVDISFGICNFYDHDTFSFLLLFGALCVKRHVL
jgi:hypothetical protein